MINYKEFEVVKAMVCKKLTYPDEIYNNTYHYVFGSVDEVRDLITSLERKGYVDKGQVTDLAIAEIEACKVKNAIILAAGSSDVSAKSVYSIPKGLFMKDGETLIERQISVLPSLPSTPRKVPFGHEPESSILYLRSLGVRRIMIVRPSGHPLVQDSLNAPALSSSCDMCHPRTVQMRSCKIVGE